jgi:hypothetical protein
MSLGTNDRAVLPREGRRRPDAEEVLEVDLLLPRRLVQALIEAGRRQGLSAGALARQVIGEYLRRKGMC